jgi:hypothetical protein
MRRGSEKERVTWIFQEMDRKLGNSLRLSAIRHPKIVGMT